MNAHFMNIMRNCDSKLVIIIKLAHSCMGDQQRCI